MTRKPERRPRVRRARVSIAFLCVTVSASAAERATDPAPASPVIPVGLDAYRMWDRWSHQRIGVRAYMRSTYDRAGGNQSADASHFLYQTAEDFNVTLDVEGTGVLYFVRTNHWHGSPWHYEVDGEDFVVTESTTADPTQKLDHSVFLPEDLFPNPLTWTYALTKGADLMWVPIPFEKRLRLAYSRTFYGTGYYIYHLYDPSANLSQPIQSWDRRTPPDPAVLALLDAAGTDISPAPGPPAARRVAMSETSGALRLPPDRAADIARIDDAPAMMRALKLSVPRDRAVAFGRARLRITWDERDLPSVDAPVDLFFGTGTLHNRNDVEYLVKALPVNVRFDDQRVHLACYFPMPFFESARVELYGAAEAIDDVRWSVRTQPYAGPPNHVAYFHATYADHGVPKPGEDLVFLDTSLVEGGGDWSGSFVGTSFVFSDRAVLRTLEGDPRFFFDDSLTPQAQGTGTEEWAGGGDYWGGENMTLPLAGHPVGVKDPGQADDDEELIQSAYRYLLADLMPFGKRALIRMEHGGRNESTERYRSVTYWYGLPAPSLVLTDVLDVGNPESERDHGYDSPDASEPYEITSRYEWGVDTLRAPHAWRPLAEPVDYADFEFWADGAKTYTIWLRGRSAGDGDSDSVWLQFGDFIGTDNLPDSHRRPWGLGNWRDAVGPGVWTWSSSMPGASPVTVTFEESGRHRMRLQVKNGGHVIDQILLSAMQGSRPKGAEPVEKPAPSSSGSTDRIVLDVRDAESVHGGLERIDDATASIGEALRVESSADRPREVYPAHSEIGRKTAGASEFTLSVRKDNLGVLLRRTLDYRFPNQRARVYIADANPQVGGWRFAGIWYLAGANTYYHSYPRRAGELGRSDPVVHTSNRRFRDDEFMIPRALTQGRSSLRVRVETTRVETPLLPDRPLDELAWSEIRYRAYSFVLPDFEPAEKEGR